METGRHESIAKVSRKGPIARSTVDPKPNAAVSADRVSRPNILVLQRSLGNRAVSSLLSTGTVLRRPERGDPQPRPPVTPLVIQRAALAPLPDPIGAHPDNELNRVAFKRHAMEARVCDRNTKTMPECIDQFNLDLGFDLKVDTWSTRWKTFTDIVDGTAPFTVTSAVQAWSRLDLAVENVLFSLANKAGGLQEVGTAIKLPLRNLAEHHGLAGIWPDVTNAATKGHWNFKKKHFNNHPERLPKGTGVVYTEFRVPPPEKNVNSTAVNINPGALRGVFTVLPNGKYKLYFSDEHYGKGSFTRVVNGPALQGAFEAQ